MSSLPVVLLVATIASAEVQAGTSDQLEPVRQLYASADYESALAALETLAPNGPPADAIEMQRYRALCLMALGRTGDAESAIERILSIDPAYQADEQESPRMRAAYASVRARVLPQVARTLYAEGRAAYDRREHQAAVSAFERAIAVVDSLESGDAALNDLRTVASGFVDLSRAAMAPPPVPAPPAPDPPPATAAGPPADQPPPAASEPRSTGTATPPVVLRQVMPPWNPAAFGTQFQSEFRGAIEVTIDEAGVVTSARMIEPVHPAYDPELLAAAKTWQYDPARLDGQPVVSTKRVDVVLRPRD